MRPRAIMFGITLVLVLFLAACSKTHRGFDHYFVSSDPDEIAKLDDGQGSAPNHRYTTRLAIRSAMTASGWIPEGAGAAGVVGCAQQLLE